MIETEKRLLKVIAYDVSVMQEFMEAMATAHKANVIKPEDYFEYGSPITSEQAQSVIKSRAIEYMDIPSDSDRASYILGFNISRKMFHRLLESYRVYNMGFCADINKELHKWVDARDRIVMANLGLAFKMAIQRSNIDGVTMDDLLKEGICGLIKAASLYRPDLPSKFCTMATWWVRQKIMKYIDDTSRTVRIPGIVSGNIRKYQRAVDHLTVLQGRAPTTEEICKYTDMSEEKVRLAIQSTFSYAPCECNSITDIGISDGSCLQDVALEVKDLRTIIEGMVGRLPEDYRSCICSIYGINTDAANKSEAISKEEFSKLNGMPMSKVNELEREAISWLRRESKTLKAHSAGILTMV
jgi:RNA polymerase primary sigma factor